MLPPLSTVTPVTKLLLDVYVIDIIGFSVPATAGVTVVVESVFLPRVNPGNVILPESL